MIVSYLSGLLWVLWWELGGDFIGNYWLHLELSQLGVHIS